MEGTRGSMLHAGIFCPITNGNQSSAQSQKPHDQQRQGFGAITNYAASFLNFGSSCSRTLLNEFKLCLVFHIGPVNPKPRTVNSRSRRKTAAPTIQARLPPQTVSQGSSRPAARCRPGCCRCGTLAAAPGSAHVASALRWGRLQEANGPPGSRGDCWYPVG